MTNEPIYISAQIPAFTATDFLPEELGNSFGGYFGPLADDGVGLRALQLHTEDRRNPSHKGTEILGALRAPLGKTLC